MDNILKNCAIVLAGGSGKRMGTDVPKQFLDIDGKPLLYYTLSTFEKSTLITDIILVSRECDIEYCQKEIVDSYGFKKVSKIVAGGKERYDSVYNAIKAAGDFSGFFFIHDGARACVSQDIIEKLFCFAIENGNAVAAVRSKDTVKISADDQSVIDTPNRSNVWIIQTPQVFDATTIKAAYEAFYADGATDIITDDAMLMEKYSDKKVYLCESEYTNIKVTTPEDIDLVKNWIKN